MANANLKVIETSPMDKTANADKQRALDAALAQIDRAFGKGSVMRLGQRNAIEIETISTGSVARTASTSVELPSTAPRLPPKGGPGDGPEPDRSGQAGHEAPHPVEPVGGAGAGRCHNPSGSSVEA